MSFNLIEQLTAEDRRKIENYIRLYGVSKNFIGIDKWLTYWGKEKIKLYKLLGNQLICRIPFEYDRPLDEQRRLCSKLNESSSFPDDFIKWVRNIFYKEEVEINLIEDSKYDNRKEVYWICLNFLSSPVLANNAVREGLKLKMANKPKELQIQKGAKPMRVINRFLEYFKDSGIDGIDELLQSFEEYRLAHSRIFNDKKVKGNLVLSIHPLDYMTMSDNDMGWQSCMSWVDEGCYHEGTVEMMNSNNVLCCYIENTSADYNFGGRNLIDGEDEADYHWTNKKWRQLVYVTKDIAVCGKAYPYQNEEFSKAILAKVEELAKENLNWTYSFGPELYKDMVYINSLYTMNRARKYRKIEPKKHNIIFDTKGMYNDMLNDSETNYWCIRNKVDKTKIISYSGKAPCLCCGESIISENDEVDDEDDDYWDSRDQYNRRYNNTDNVVCEDCLDKFFKCQRCSCDYPRSSSLHDVNIGGTSFKLCNDCLRTFLRECPSCNKPMIMSTTAEEDALHHSGALFPVEPIKTYIRVEEEINDDDFIDPIFYYSYRSQINSMTSVKPVCMCADCYDKYNKDKKFALTKLYPKKAYMWIDPIKKAYITTEVEKESDWEKYMPCNLKKYDIFKDGMEINLLGGAE